MGHISNMIHDSNLFRGYEKRLLTPLRLINATGQLASSYRPLAPSFPFKRAGLRFKIRLIHFTDKIFALDEPL